MTLLDVLAPYGVDEDEFVAALATDLAATPDATASRLTESELGVLREHGGIEPVVDEAIGAATVRTAASNLAAQTRESLSVEQAADLLGVDGSRVRHRVRDRALYAFKIGGALRLPIWQFENGEAIPALRAVIAALPAELHPLELAGFMTSPDADLAVAEDPTSPRDWLIGGGDANVVVELIEHLDAW